MACDKETKFIYISTDQVYGNLSNCSENIINPQPINEYGKTKLLGEKKVQEHCIEYMIIRTNIFGWNIKPASASFAEWIYNALKNEKKINLFTDYYFSPIYTKYLAEIIIKLVQINFFGLINIGSLEPCSKFKFAKELAYQFNLSDSSLLKGSLDDHSFIAQRNKNLTININKLLGLGFEVPTYEESIKYFVKDKLC